MSSDRDELLEDALNRSLSRLLCRMVGPSPLHPKLQQRRVEPQAEPASAWAVGHVSIDFSGRSPLVQGAGDGVPATAGV